MKKQNIILCIHAGLLLWVLLLLCSVFIIPDGGKTASVLAVGNILFLLFNIPFSVYSLVLKKKGFFSERLKGAVGVLSVLNIVAGAIVWVFVILILMMP